MNIRQLYLPAWQLEEGSSMKRDLGWEKTFEYLLCQEVH